MKTINKIFWGALILLVVYTILVLVPTSIDFTITGFVAEGRLPIVGEDSGNWGTLLNTYLTQEHTAEGGHKNVTIQDSLDVDGNGNFTGNIIADNLTDSSGGIISIPSGFIGMFNTTVCPTGWNEMTESKGRYFVSLPSSGTLGAIGGTALSNNENRTVGQHSHTVDPPDTSASITDDGHTHSAAFRTDIDVGSAATALTNINSAPSAVTTASATTGITATTNIAEFNSGTNGSVAGTNAPYIQILVCVKT